MEVVIPVSIFRKRCDHVLVQKHVPSIKSCGLGRRFLEIVSHTFGDPTIDDTRYRSKVAELNSQLLSELNRAIAKKQLIYSIQDLWTKGYLAKDSASCLNDFVVTFEKWILDAEQTLSQLALSK